MNGRPLAIPELASEAPAVVESWFLGSQHGRALADVLFGDYNPGGKLPATFPRSTGQIPIYYNHRNTGRPGDSAAKYTSKYLDLPLTPLFPFGYGLSYTTFAYSNLRLSSPRIGAGDSIEVAVDLRNTGDRAGDEVVQLYVRDDVASVAEPVRALKAFRRVTLRPGETRTVTFKLGPSSFALYDRPDAPRGRARNVHCLRRHRFQRRAELALRVRRQHAGARAVDAALSMTPGNSGQTSGEQGAEAAQSDN